MKCFPQFSLNSKFVSKMMLALIFTELFVFCLSSNIYQREVYESAFAEHVDKFDLKFENGNEFVRRLQIFADNYDIIEEHNSKDLSWKMGFNQFSHMTPDEFSDYVKISCPRFPRPEEVIDSELLQNYSPSNETLDLPQSVDWSKTGAVSPVQNQGNFFLLFHCFIK